MAYVLDIADTTELNLIVRNLPADQIGYPLAQILPERRVMEVEFSVADLAETEPEIAQFRSYDEPHKKISRPGWTRTTGRIPPLSAEVPLSEKDRMDLEELRTGDAARLRQLMFDDGRRATSSVHGRLELARGQLLTRGEMTFTVDRGWDEDLKIDFGATTTITAPSTKWDQSSATPLSDLADMVEEYRDANYGDAPGFILTSTRVVNNILATTQVRQQAGVPGSIASPIVTRAQLDGMTAAMGLPPIRTYDKKVTIGGVATRVTPDDEITLLPTPGTFGNTLHGVTPESTKLVRQGYISRDEAPGITVLWIETESPVQLKTVASAVSLPVITASRVIGNVKVLT